jgi:hypothetical protein
MPAPPPHHTTPAPPVRLSPLPLPPPAEDIARTDRFREPPEEGIMSDALWSDPQPFTGRGPSKRGVGACLSPGQRAGRLGVGGGGGRTQSASLTSASLRLASHALARRHVLRARRHGAVPQGQRAAAAHPLARGACTHDADGRGSGRARRSGGRRSGGGGWPTTLLPDTSMTAVPTWSSPTYRTLCRAGHGGGLPGHARRQVRHRLLRAQLLR